MKKLLWKIGLWFLNKSKQPFHLLVIGNPALMVSARFAVKEAERVALANQCDNMGLFKQQTAMRIIMNQMPQETEHDISNAIQIAVDELKNVQG